MFLIKQEDTSATLQHPLVAPVDSETGPVDHVHTEDEPLEMQRVAAIGFSQAEDALPQALDKSPFPVHVPNYIPDGLSLERFSLSTFGSSDAALDLYYTIADTTVIPRPAVHVWQTNRAYVVPGEPLQQASEDGSFSIDGNIWSYWLLAYPQPDGHVSELYNAETTLANGISITVDVRAGYDPSPAQREATFEDLQLVIASLEVAD